CRRVTKCVGQLLAFKKPRLGKAAVEVSLPGDLEKWLKANEIELDFPAKGGLPKLIGKKGWALLQMVGMVPPSHWREAWKRTPGEIVAAAARNEWSEAILIGFHVAAGRDPDPEWVEALVAHGLNQRGRPGDVHVNWFGLASSLPVNRLEALALDALGSDTKGLNDDHPALWLLLEHRREWSDELSRVVVESVRRRIGKGGGDSNRWRVKAALKQFAQFVRPGMCDEVCAGWPEQAAAWPQWEGAVEALRGLLRFRRDMLKAIDREDDRR
ncbi:MAG: hypothetical protein ACRD68_15445, partial [Pyrinomonadaceae bacterium]